MKYHSPVRKPKTVPGASTSYAYRALLRQRATCSITPGRQYYIVPLWIRGTDTALPSPSVECSERPIL